MVMFGLMNVKRQSSHLLIQFVWGPMNSTPAQTWIWIHLKNQGFFSLPIWQLNTFIHTYVLYIYIPIANTVICLFYVIWLIICCVWPGWWNTMYWAWLDLPTRPRTASTWSDQWQEVWDVGTGEDIETEESTSPKTNMDTQNDGLEKVDSFKIYGHFGIHVRFLGVNEMNKPYMRMSSSHIFVNSLHHEFPFEI